MRFTYIKLKGYVGIYNGLGLNEIEIDLSKCTHKICLIVGINGCGKSTLLNAMSIMPDSSSDFIQGVNAEKDLQLVNGNDVYDIKITSASAKCGRGISKASIIKNGIELNPNGNIGSYKEVVFQEFDLDSNFIALSKLSSENRGIADKSPAERKKMVSFIVDSLETYNAIYKNLNKKSSIFKSYVNNLHTKIQNIGDEATITAVINDLSSKRDYIKSQIEFCTNETARLQALLAVYDADGSIQSKYEEADKEAKEANKATELAYKDFVTVTQILGIDPDQDSVIRFIRSNTELMKTHEDNRDLYDKSRLGLVEKNESLTMNIENNKRKIDSLKAGIDPDLRKAEYNMSSKVNEEKEVLKKLGVTNPDNTSREELKYTFDAAIRIVNMVDDLYYEMDENLMAMVLSFNNSEMNKLNIDIQNQLNLIEELKKNLEVIKSDNEVISILSNRPKECSIDDCYFIKKAYVLQKEKYSTISVQKVFEDTTIELTKQTDRLDALSKEFDMMSVVAQKRDKLNLIRNIIDSNRDMLIKSSICSILVNEFESRIAKMRSFNDFKDLDELLQQVNVISMYQEDIAILRRLQSELSSQANSEKMISQFESENVSFIEERDKIQKELAEYAAKISSYNTLIDTINSKIQLANKANEKCMIWMEAKKNSDEKQKLFNESIEKSRSSIKTLDEITRVINEKYELQQQLEPVEREISVQNGQLMMLESYKNEYAMYSEKYNMVETLKKYSSPTSGIQTIFMSIYMSKTLDLANRVLSMIFGGQYQLLNYVINANEFKIPFIGQGMRVDDISSGSTSQICIIGMVLNLVLKYQASNKYNIASLDEIDGGLDTRNRLSYVNVLYKLIDILEIDQLFVISHSLELESSNVDVIRLKQYQDYGESSTIEGNIIYDFNQLQH